MTGVKLDIVGRTIYRALIRKAKRFDKDPVLKTIITRDLEDGLPEPLDGIVAQFLGGEEICHYWPQPGNADTSSSVTCTVRDAFRRPPKGADLDGAFQGQRYLAGLLSIADKHQILAKNGATVSSAFGQSNRAPIEAARRQAEAVRPLDWPEEGAILLAHPCVGGWFSESAVLICHHHRMGSYGLCLNKPLGSSVRELTDKIQELKEVGETSNSTKWQARAGELMGMLPAASFQLKPLMMGPTDETPPSLSCPASVLHALGQATTDCETVNNSVDTADMPELAPVLRAIVSIIGGGQGENKRITLKDVSDDMLLYKLRVLASGTADESDDEDDDEDESDDDEEDESDDEEDGEEEDNEFDDGLSGEDSDDSSEPDSLWWDDPEEGPVLHFEVTPDGLRPIRHPFDRRGRRRHYSKEDQRKLFEIFTGIKEEDVAEEVQKLSREEPAFLHTSAGEQGLAPEQQQVEEDSQGHDCEAGRQSVRSQAAPLSTTDHSSQARSSTGGVSSTWQAASSSNACSSNASDSDCSSTQSTPSIEGGSRLACSEVPTNPTDLAEGVELTVGQVLELFDGSGLLRGGPVEGLQVLHCRREFGGEPVIQPLDGEGTDEGVFVGAKLKDAPELMRQGKLSAKDVMIFVGDSQWDGIQLEEEWEQGTWLAVRADKEVVDLFNRGRQQQKKGVEGQVGEMDLWRQLMYQLGPQYAAMTCIPAAVWKDLRELTV